MTPAQTFDHALEAMIAGFAAAPSYLRFAWLIIQLVFLCFTDAVIVFGPPAIAAWLLICVIRYWLNNVKPRGVNQ